MGKDSDNGGSPIFIFLVGLLVVSVVFVFSPGMVLMSCMQLLSHMTLDIGQMWTFSIVLSIIIGLVLWSIYKDKTLTIYPILCLTIVACCLIAHFGLKASFPRTFLSFFFGK